MSICAEDMYHVAMVTPDLDAICAELTRTSHVVWGPEIRAEIPVWTRDIGEVRLFKIRAVYSIRAPHIEVVQTVPRTFLTAKLDRPLHHVGYWSDDLAAESDFLERQGWPRIACGMADGTVHGFAFHVTPDGLLQKLVDREVFPDWKGFLAGRKPFRAEVVPAKRFGGLRVIEGSRRSVELDAICEARRFCPPTRFAALRFRGDRYWAGELEEVP